jgi:hypothetical protein
MTYGAETEFCTRRCADGYAWCVEHTPRRIRDSDRVIRNQEAYVLFLPLVMQRLRRHTVALVGYFEHRWSGDRWQCPLALNCI